MNWFGVGFTIFRFNNLTDCTVLTLLVIQFNRATSLMRMSEITRYPRGPHHTGPMFGVRINLFRVITVLLGEGNLGEH
jgi:hypothetical protein